MDEYIFPSLCFVFSKNIMKRLWQIVTFAVLSDQGFYPQEVRQLFQRHSHSLAPDLTDWRGPSWKCSWSHKDHRAVAKATVAGDHDRAVAKATVATEVKERAMEDAGAGSMDPVCNTCLARKKGAALFPCGHTFCWKCTSDLRRGRGPCPSCNHYFWNVLSVSEVL